MAYPNNPYPASYKVYNGSAWIEYYFRTSADLVGETGPYNGDQSYARKFVTNKVYVNGVAFAFSSLPTQGAVAEVTINASNINWYGGTKPTTNYLGSAANIQAALQALDNAIAAGPDINTFVPYTGATQDLNLGSGNELKFGSSYGLKVYNNDLLIYTGTGSIVLSSEVKAYYGSATANDEIATHGWVENKGYVLSSSLGSAATKGVATSISSSSTNDDLATALAVYNAIASLPDPMQFKGTIGDSGTYEWANLPTASGHSGWTLKAITPNAQIQVKAGDTIISNGTEWVVIPSGDEPSGTVTNISTGSGLTGGPITSTGTISLATAYGDTVNPYGSKTANYVLAAPNGSAGVPTFRALVADDIPDLSGSYLPLSGGTLTGDVSLGTHSVIAQSYLFSSDYESMGIIGAARTGASGTYDITITNDVGAIILNGTNGGYLGSVSNDNIIASHKWVDDNYAKVTVGANSPSSPSSGDIWIQVD